MDGPLTSCAYTPFVLPCRFLLGGGWVLCLWLWWRWLLLWLAWFWLGWLRLVPCALPGREVLLGCMVAFLFLRP